MDLPERQWYGVKCPRCIAILWSANKATTELRCALSFKDKGLPYIEDDMGIIVGFGFFKHNCLPELNN